MVRRTIPFTKSLALGNKSMFYSGNSNRTPEGKGVGDWGAGKDLCHRKLLEV